VSFEIHPETPPEGVPLAVRLPDVDWDELYENLRRTGTQYQIMFGKVTLLSNSRLALEASEFAREQGMYDLFSEKVFHVYFTEARDIGRQDVVMELAGAAGLDVEALQDALLQGRYAQRLRKAQEEGQLYNITGVPAFIINEKHMIVGAQPLEVFRDTLKRCA
jgi:predicted DsbA family dithiol-disulfide isomerase